MDGYRNIEPLGNFKGLTNEPGPAPEILFLEPRQLVVNEEYQRSLSRPSRMQIGRMASDWDWSSFKAPSVARTDDPELFEVVDGQHTAIAAATNGNVPFLPCLVMSAETLAEKAKGFLGINTARRPLTQADIFNAKVAAQDETAIAAYAAMSVSGVEALPFPPNNGKWKVGNTMAIGTMMDLAKRRGQARLETILQIAVKSQAAPVSACLVKALDIAMPLALTPEVENRVVAILRGQQPNRLEMIAQSRTPPGRRSFETFADIIADMAKLPEKRMGLPAKRKPGRQPKALAA